MGSCQTIKIALGNKTRKAINIPLIIELIFKSMTAIRNPTTIHIVNADKFASQVRFCKIIGITSIIPATIPNNIPILIFFAFILLQILPSANIAANVQGLGVRAGRSPHEASSYDKTPPDAKPMLCAGYLSMR